MSMAQVCLFFEFTAKTAMRLRGYLIRLTREYTDGGMDSHAELDSCIKPSLMFAPPSMYPWVRRANGTRTGPPCPYI
jgi:hypothetical protein